MSQMIALTALVVRDYDEAIAWFRDKLDFTLVEDRILNPQKRWVVVAPPGDAGGTHILLARAEGETQAARIGDQTGGRVCIFLRTDDFDRDHAAMMSRGVRFTESPRYEPYGTVVVFEDLYGNHWDLLQPPQKD